MRCAMHVVPSGDMAREQHLDGILDESSRRIEQWLVTDEQSPSEAVQQAEELLKVADAVYQLPDAERAAVIGYYWQQGTLADISEELGPERAGGGRIGPPRTASPTGSVGRGTIETSQNLWIN